MTTLIPFLIGANQSPPFQTIVTLDRQSYTLEVRWNFAAQRWFVTLTDSFGNTAWHGALVGSPLNFNILLAPGIFQTSTLLYREDTGNFEITP